jgi:hypothetical protein
MLMYKVFCTAIFAVIATAANNNNDSNTKNSPTTACVNVHLQLRVEAMLRTLMTQCQLAA